MAKAFLKEIPQNIFTNVEQIGSGTFSDIYSAIYMETKTKVALKIFLKNEEELKMIKKEIEVSKLLNHPFICKYFSYIETDHLNIIVMELIKGTNALDYVNKSYGIPINEALDIFTQLVIAIEYLHNEKHITHRDLKLENIMIDKFNHIRLIDFGFSSVNSIMSTCCGSVPYCAPEVLMGKKYSKAADIWSLGVIFYALIDGNLPFYHSNIKYLASMICSNEVTFSSKFTNNHVCDLLKKMLNKDPVQRITIDEVLKHPSLSKQKILNINYKQVFNSFLNDSSSQNVIDNQNSHSKSYTFIDFDPYNNHYPLLKKLSSSIDSRISTDNSKVNNLNEHYNKLDELIKKRDDFELNLNKLIDNSLMNSFPQKCILLHSTLSNNLGSLQRVKIRKRSNPCVLKSIPPLIQPNVNNKININ